MEDTHRAMTQEEHQRYLNRMLSRIQQDHDQIQYISDEEYARQRGGVINKIIRGTK